MRTAITCILLSLLLLADAAAQVEPVSKAIDTSWLEQSALKYGFLASICTAQAMTGLTEGYQFRQGPTHIINAGNYHAYATLRRAGWLATGWFGYANVRDADLRWYQKGARLIGAGLISRNCFEWSYKAARYGNPFDYSEAHNEHALVYFKFDNGGLTDAYIGTGPVSGPFVDMACLSLGWLLFK